ncbi:MAG: glycosyltransferase family 4 protein [Acidobacteriota bacterium]
MNNRIRVLLIAEMCNPDWISIPLEGWCHGQAIAALTDTHLVTHTRNRENIAKAGLIEGQHFTALDAPMTEACLHTLGRLAGARAMGNKSWTTLTALSAVAYYPFERQVWQRFGAGIRGGAYDVVHRLTPMSPTVPSLLARWCRRAGVPFVMGPLNGGLAWPAQFGHLRAVEREWLSYVRGAYKLLPGYRSTRQNASAIVAGSASTRAEIDAEFQAKTVYVPENAIDPTRFERQCQGPPARPLRVVFIGRLVPYKGADILIEAAAPLARAGQVVLDIIGDGPEMARLQSLAQAADATHSVRFPGWIPHRDLQQYLDGAHVFAFPSVREFGGAVVLEAMALGLVPIVMDYGGPGELVTASTGFVLPMASRDDIVASLRAVLERLVATPSQIAPIGARARARAQGQFTWQVKAQQMVHVYNWVLGREGKPNFGMPLTDLPDAETVETGGALPALGARHR